MGTSTGKYLILLGLAIVVIGLIIHFFGSRLSFLGRLPGDIRIEGERGGFYFPLVTCLLLSVVLTALVRLVQWFMNR